MRLYRGKVEAIADEVVRTLRTQQMIEVDNEAEAKLDIESVLKEHLRMERELVDEAKNRMEARGLGYSNLGRVKGQVARERGAAEGDETLPYLLEQILNILFHSNNVGEVFAEDADLRKAVTPILRKHMDVDTDLDREVRSKIKNLEDGSSTFDVEYARVMEQIKHKRGLS